MYVRYIAAGALAVTKMASSPFVPSPRQTDRDAATLFTRDDESYLTLEGPTYLEVR